MNDFDNFTHGTIIYSDGGFHVVHRVDLDGRPLRPAEVVSMPLGPLPGSPKRRRIDPAMLEALLGTGDIEIVAHPAEIAPAPAAPLHWRQVPSVVGIATDMSTPGCPTAKPAVERLFRDGLVFRGAELERRRAANGKGGNGHGHDPR